MYSNSTIGRVCPWQTSGICTRLALLMAANCRMNATEYKYTSLLYTKPAQN